MSTQPTNDMGKHMSLDKEARVKVGVESACEIKTEQAS